MPNSPNGKKDWELTQESFDRLLRWLDPDPEIAARILDKIKTRLIKIFSCRRFVIDPEHLADLTIDRVAKKLPDIVDSFVGNPAVYFYSVADYIYRESIRPKPPPPPPSPDPPDDDLENEYDCLDKCMAKLNEGDRRLVLEYYCWHEEKAKVRRKAMADGLKIGLNALRIKVCRIRTTLRDCVEDCLRQVAA